jgi:prolyl-tRNA synthetase
MAEDKLTSRSENYSDWYNQVVLRADLADYAPVRGCMVVKPYGWALWEIFSVNWIYALRRPPCECRFPLLIPKSFFEKKRTRGGLRTKLAVVTIGGGEELEEPLIIRPTSETIIGLCIQNGSRAIVICQS